MFTQVSVILKPGLLKHFGKLILVTSIISEPISQHDLIPLYRIWPLKKKKMPGFRIFQRLKNV